MKIYKIQSTKEAGLFDGIKTLFEPEPTNPYIPKADPDANEHGRYVIDDERFGFTPLKKPDDIDINEVEKLVNDYGTPDADELMATHKALEYIKKRPNEKLSMGLKVALYYLCSRSKRPEVPKFKYIIKQWYKDLMGITAGSK